MRQVVNRADVKRQASVKRSPCPQTPHPRAIHARTRGIEFPISRPRPFGPPGEHETTRTYSFSSHIGPFYFRSSYSWRRIVRYGLDTDLLMDIPGTLVD